MPTTLHLPDLRRTLDNLRGRIEVLERRIRPQVDTGGDHEHEGTGTDSIIVSGDTQSTVPIAAGNYAVSIGEGASAPGASSLALGRQAFSLGNQSLAFGRSAYAAHDASIALGDNVSTTADSQVNVGVKRLFAGVPTTAAADADLIASQVTFYLNEAANTLTIKVKYSDGSTVKTGTVALV